MKTSVIIGKNPRSLLISLALFERNKKVYLVDSKREKDSWYITDVERVMLKTWGLDCQVQPLLEIDKYLEAGPNRFVFEGKHLNLGNLPAQNLNEIFRKIPDLISHESLRNEKARDRFNRLYNKFIEDLGVKVFRFLDHDNITFENLWLIFPEELKGIFKDIKKNSQKKNLGLSLCFFQGVFQGRFALERSDLSLMLLLIFLISPRFKVNQEDLEEALTRVFKKNGGEFLNANEISFLANGNSIQKFALPRNNGKIIEKLFLSCGKFQEYALMPRILPSYTSVKIRTNLKSLEFKNQEFFFSDTKRIGGDHPYTRILFSSEYVEGEVLCPFIKGSKLSLEEKNVVDIFLRDLSLLLGEISLQGLKIDCNFSHYFWSEMPTNVHWPYFSKNMKNLKIFHQSHSCPWGAFSLLTQIKDERGHIL